MITQAIATLFFCLAIVGYSQMAAGRRIDVSDANSLAAAISMAKAGDDIVLAPGTYRLGKLTCGGTGTPDRPIVVRAAKPLASKIEFTSVEGFLVTGPNWRFENLDIKGSCAEDSTCEHAFHVVGAADRFTMRGNRIFDFNAHLKVNFTPGPAGSYEIPDDGLVESNEFGNTHPRNTDSPVTPVNIDNGSRWVVRLNYIHDFQKTGGNRVSYGVFVKGGGSDPIFERNLVLGERDIKASGDVATIGLSFGGGGMSPAMCVPAFDARFPCNPEVNGGVMRNNIIANCTDVGIYLNNADGAKLLYNTLVGTSGIDVRFSGSKAEIHGNVLTGKIRERNGGSFTGGDNLVDVSASVFQTMYMDPMKGDLRRKGSLSSILDKGSPNSFLSDDYCGRSRTDGKPDWGALEHGLGDCRTTRP